MARSRFSLLCMMSLFVCCQRNLRRIEPTQETQDLSFSLRTSVAVRGKVPLRVTAAAEVSFELVAQGVNTQVIGHGEPPNIDIDIPTEIPAGVHVLRSSGGTTASVLVLAAEPTITSITTAAGDSFGRPQDQLQVRGSGFDPRATLNNQVLINDSRAATVLTATENLLVVELPSDVLAGDGGGTLNIAVVLDGVATQQPGHFSLLGVPQIVGTIPGRAAPDEPITVFLSNTVEALLGCEREDPGACTRALGGVQLSRGLLPLSELELRDVGSFPGAPSGSVTAIGARMPSNLNMPADDALRLTNKRGDASTPLPLIPGGNLQSAAVFDVIRFSAQTQDDTQILPMSSQGIVRYQRRARRLEYLASPGDGVIARTVPGEGLGPQIDDAFVRNQTLARNDSSPGRGAFAVLPFADGLLFSRVDRQQPWLELPPSDAFVMVQAPERDTDTAGMLLAAYDQQGGTWSVHSADAGPACPQRHCAQLAAPAPFLNVGGPFLFEDIYTSAGGAPRAFVAYFTLNAQLELRPVVLEITGSLATDVSLVERTETSTCPVTPIMTEALPLHFRTMYQPTNPSADPGVIGIQEKAVGYQILALRLPLSGSGCVLSKIDLPAISASNPVHSVYSTGAACIGSTCLFGVGLTHLDAAVGIKGGVLAYSVPPSFSMPWSATTLATLPANGSDKMNAVYFGPSAPSLFGELVAVAPNPTSLALHLSVESGPPVFNTLHFDKLGDGIPATGVAISRVGNELNILTPSGASLTQATVPSFVKPTQPFQVVTQATSDYAWVVHSGKGSGFDIERYSSSGVISSVLSAHHVDADVTFPTLLVPDPEQPTRSVAAKHRLLPTADGDHFLVATNPQGIELRSLQDPAAIERANIEESDSTLRPISLGWLPSLEHALVLWRSCSPAQHVRFGISTVQLNPLAVSPPTYLPETLLPCACVELELAVQAAAAQDTIAITYPSAVSHDCSEGGGESETTSVAVPFNEQLAVPLLAPLAPRVASILETARCEDGVVAVGRDFLTRYTAYDAATHACAETPALGKETGLWQLRGETAPAIFSVEEFTSPLGTVSDKPTRAAGSRSGRTVLFVDADTESAGGGGLRLFARTGNGLALKRVFSLGANVADFAVSASGEQIVVLTADGLSVVR